MSHKIKLTFLIYVVFIALLIVIPTLHQQDITGLYRLLYGASPEGISTLALVNYLVLFFGPVYIYQLMIQTDELPNMTYRLIRYGTRTRWEWSLFKRIAWIAIWYMTILLLVIYGMVFYLNERTLFEGLLLPFYVTGMVQLIFYGLLSYLFSKKSAFILFIFIAVGTWLSSWLFPYLPFGLNSLGYMEQSHFVLIALAGYIVSIYIFLLVRKKSTIEKGEDPMNVITLDGVSKTLGGQTLFSDVSLSIEKGRIYGFVGRNGIGKSVLFKLICGFEQVDSGKVHIHNDYIDGRRDFPKEFGIIIDRPGYLANKTGYQNLHLLAAIRGEITGETIKETMRVVGLDPASTTKLKKYSLGMKQKLAIAQAIMENQQILLLDEPLNALDSESVDAMRQLFLTLKSEGKTILLTSHNQEDIDILCDVVYEIKDQQIFKK